MARILVVDDSISMRQMVVFTLERAGFEVTEAANGDDALNAARKQQFDIIVSDTSMPKMDGISLVKVLREIDNYKSVPILMLSTDCFGEANTTEKKAGASGRIAKPFNPDQLLATVNKLLY